MIKISEKVSKKLPCDTSLFITFDYKQEIVDYIKVIKNRDGAEWSKTDKVWEVPISCLSELVNNLCYFDDLDIELMPTDDTCNNRHITVDYKTKPLGHQVEGIEYGLNHDKWLLLDKPGLGKTLQALYLAEERKSQDGIEHCLIICGVNSLKSNWKDEANKHSHLDAIIVGERVTSTGSVVIDPIPKRIEQLKNKIDQFFIIINIEAIRDDGIVDAIINGPNKIDMIVFDEMHKCKGRPKRGEKDSGTKQSANLLKLKAKYQLGMTGTLIVNNPLDAFVPLTWIDAIRCTFTNFKKYFFVLGGNSGFQPIKLKNHEEFKDLLSSHSLRRTEDVLRNDDGSSKLPPITMITEYLDLSDDHKKFYDAIKMGIKEEADLVDLHPANVLAMITRLRQATSCPSVLTSKGVVSSKLDRAQDLVEQIISQGDKVVVFSSFKESVYELANMLSEYNPIVVTGDNSDTEAWNLKEDFCNNPDRKIFIATWQKMGTGFTLTPANYMIHIDTAWNAALYEQTYKRIHRISADKPVFNYNLVCKDTIDERVLSIVEDKGLMSDYLVDDVLNENTISNLRKYIQDL